MERAAQLLRQDGVSMDAIAARLNAYIRNGDPAALPEAEKALKKYPNSFTLVHGCAQIYNVFGSEKHDPVYLRRALDRITSALSQVGLTLPPQPPPRISPAQVSQTTM